MVSVAVLLTDRPSAQRFVPDTRITRERFCGGGDGSSSSGPPLLCALCQCERQTTFSSRVAHSVDRALFERFCVILLFSRFSIAHMKKTNQQTQKKNTSTIWLFVWPPTTVIDTCGFGVCGVCVVLCHMNILIITHTQIHRFRANAECARVPAHVIPVFFLLNRNDRRDTVVIS